MPNSVRSTIESGHHTEKLTFQTATKEDGAKMWELVSDTGVLDVNSPYSYLMMAKFFNKSSIVAKENDRMAGFVTAFHPPESPHTIFVWQIGVSKEYQGQGIGSKLLHALLKSPSCENTTYLEATISPSNVASQSLFKKLARSLNTQCHVETCFRESQFPGDGHEKEDLYRIGPFNI